jgi:chaperone modulatory protein CbpM
VAKEPIYEGILLDNTGAYTLAEICEICAVNEKVMIELVEFGVVDPQGVPQQWTFSPRAIVRLQKALRLQHDLAINWAGISLVLDLLEEVQELRQRVRLP